MMFRLPLALHVPMFGFTVLAFLMVCAILASAAFLVFKSGEKGQTKLGGCAGCAIGFALLAIAGLAAAMCVGVMVLTTRAEILRHGPVRSLELQFGDRDEPDEIDVIPGPPGAEAKGTGGTPLDSSPRATEGDRETRHAVHLKLVIRGKEYPAKISEWVRENSEGDVSVTMTTEGDRTVVDYGLPFTREQLKQFKRDLKEALPGMKLPKGIKVEIKDADD